MTVKTKLNQDNGINLNNC